ncbi:hypothetical protein Tco_0490712 [Tanacetum coccineum]
MVPRAVLMKSVLVSIDTARQVNTTHTKTTVNGAGSMSNLSKTAHSTIKRPTNKNTTFKNYNFNQRVNTVRGNNVNIARPKAVVNAVKGNHVNVVKASACWVWKPMIKVIYHVSKHNSASITLKKFDYVDAQGRSKSDQGVRILEENLHIRFSKNIPNVVGTKASNNIDPKISQDDGFKLSSDYGKKVDEDPRKEIECNDQKKEDNANSTNKLNTVSSTVNAAGTNEVNVVGKTSIELPVDPNMHALEDDSIFDYSSDDEDDGVEADMNNMDTTIQVSPILTTRIHKDHPLDQVIGDLNSTTQTRKMTKILEEYGFVGITQKGNPCIEGSKLDRGYAEALTNLKLPEVWTMVELPNGKQGIGTK